MRLLVVEDDEVLGEAIIQRIARQGHGVDLVTTGVEANEILKHQSYDLVILDLNLPNVRARESDVPVLILTARDNVSDRIELLDLGADDYLTKPFDFGELEARCRALLRRQKGQATDELVLGDLSLNQNRCVVTVKGTPIDLKQREFRLLEIFMRQKDRVLSKEDLLDRLYNFDESPSPNAIELYVGRLRKKLTNSNISIRTLRGLGYLLEYPRD